MGYFSNGTEGSQYESKYCENCIHWVGEEHKGCPVWDIQMLFNYGESEEQSEVMDLLIPRSKDLLANEQCTMFIQVKSEGQESF